MNTCPRCDNRRWMFSSSCRKRIRCTLCTRRRPDRSGKHLRELSRTSKELTGREARALVRALDAHVVHALIEKVGVRGVPQHLASTDRILKRWADAPTGTPSDNPDVYRISRLTPLDDKTQEIVNDLVKASPAGIRLFLHEWYLEDRPPQMMAKARHMSTRQLGRERDRVLVVMRQKFRDSSHPDLRNLVRFLP